MATVDENGNNGAVERSGLSVFKKLILIGIIAGVVCSISKLGWEIPFPPRTPARDATNPPQKLLEQMGFSHEFTHSTYTYSEYQRPYVAFFMHFGFSITFAVLYVLAAEYVPAIKLWQGAAYGLVIWAAFHVILLPLLGTVPPPWEQPFAEHFSEIFGHMFVFWLVEVTRSDMKNRMIGQSG